jgi:hypothetical protein
METKKQFLKRAFDGNAFISTGAYATVVNPATWDTQLRDYEAKNIVLEIKNTLFSDSKC